MPKRAQSSSPRCKSARKLRDSRDTEMQLDDAISDALEPVVAIQKVMLSIQQELREQVSQVLKKQEELQTKIQEDKTSVSELIEGSMYNMCTRMETMAELITKCRPKSGRARGLVKGCMSPDSAMILKSYGYNVPDQAVVTTGSSPISPQADSAAASSSESNSGGNGSGGTDSDSAQPSLSPSERIVLHSAGSRRLSSGRRRPRSQQNTPVEGSVMASDCSTLRQSPNMNGLDEDAPRSNSRRSNGAGNALTNSSSLQRLQRMNDEHFVQLAVEDCSDDRSPASLPTPAEQPTAAEGVRSGRQVHPETFDSLDLKSPDPKCTQSSEHSSECSFARWGFNLSRFICQTVGLQPFRSTSGWNRTEQVYRLLSVLLAAAFLTSSVLQLVKITHPDLTALGEPGRSHATVMDIVIGAGSCFVTPLLGLLQRSLNRAQANLDSLWRMALRRHFEENWFKMTSKDVAVLVLMWSLLLSERVYTALLLETTHDKIHCVLFMLVFFHLSGAAFHMLFWCRGLCCLVDNFLVNLAKGTPAASLEKSWKIRVALMRRISRGFEACFSLLCLTALLSCLALLFDIANGVQTLNLLPRVCVVLYLPLTFWQSASVTDYCSKAPATANSLIRHRDHGTDSFNVVQFIHASEAGIYIYDTRLTKGMVLKFIYFTVVALFSICTNLFDFKFMPASGVRR
eukprot:TRINITY_DN10025_c0_g2_i1.p1 TRINITY_DN10025_c0_g2~~TRINITY_DN10025_c0_g2_i1.p1  ORF type:complete len:697 (+),score=118.94 TRINITY_DN10025_c0_g2_i1:41-2092(+)